MIYLSNKRTVDKGNWSLKHKALDFVWNWHADYWERERESHRANTIYMIFIKEKLWYGHVLDIFNLQQNKSFIYNNKALFADDVCSVPVPI